MPKATPSMPSPTAADAHSAAPGDPSPTPAAAPTRERLVAAMAKALRHRGLHGVGLNELLADAQAPKGVLYHHFPGGKQALAVAAIEETAAQLTRSLDTLIARKADPVQALRQWLQASLSHLQASGFERGCPLATVALESSPSDAALRTALAAAFAALRGRVALLLQADGRLAPERAQGLAALIVSTYEGALMQARVAAEPGPMLASAETLLSLIQAEREAARPGAGGLPG